MRLRSASARLSGVFAVLVGASLGAYAHPADAAPGAADVAAARQHFSAGLKLYAEKAYAAALAEFQQAYSQAPRASIQRNIAQCQRDLHDFAAAYEAYGELVERWGATLRPQEIATTKTAMSELALFTGTIHVTVTEPGAAIEIDGHPAGATPLVKPLRVNLGRVHLVISKSGFDPIEQDIDVKPGSDATVAGPLLVETKTGHVSVTIDGGEAAHVFVDGQDVGPAPYEGDVAPGSHAIEARGAGTSGATQRIEVARRAHMTIPLVLHALVGKLQVDPHDTDAEISVDGKVVGRGVWEGDLPIGRHELAISLRGYETQRRALIVNADQTVVEDVHMVAGHGYTGLYADLDFFGLATTGGATNGIAAECPSPPCTAPSPLGAGLDVRVGHAWGWIAVEGLVFGMYDTSPAHVTYPNDVASGPYAGVARTEDYRFHRFGGGGAIGGRVTSKHPTVRFTFGAAFGLDVKAGLFSRTSTSAQQIGGVTGTNTVTSNTATYTSPILVFDGGVLLGGTVKFHLGILALAEFVGSPVLTAADATETLNTKPLGTPPLQIAGGTQLFIGPVIGLHFGD
jgi:hypothetical protein